jgi:hypothetical protein
MQGKEVIALTADTATIRNPHSGVITTYRRFNKPALGPVGDDGRVHLALVSSAHFSTHKVGAGFLTDHWPYTHAWSAVSR